MCFFFSSRRRHTRLQGDWSSDVCSSDQVAMSLSDEPAWGSDRHMGPAQRPLNLLVAKNCFFMSVPWAMMEIGRGAGRGRGENSGGGGSLKKKKKKKGGEHMMKKKRTAST